MKTPSRAVQAAPLWDALGADGAARVLRVCQDALTAWLASPARPLGKELGRAMRRAALPDHAHRAAAADWVYTVAWAKARLLRRAGRVPAYWHGLSEAAQAAALVALAVDDVWGRPERARALWPAPGAVWATWCLPLGAPADVHGLAQHASFPVHIVQAWVDGYGIAAAARIAASMNHKAPITLRANTAVLSRAALVRALDGVHTAPGVYAPDALHVDRFNIRVHPAYQAGGFEVQDEASQLVALACEVKPGDAVVDTCAGAGGKTLALWAAMSGTGALTALNLEPARAQDLRVRLARVGAGMPMAGIHSVLRTAAPSPDVPGAVPEGVVQPGSADIVLVDAPCSALGSLRRGPDKRWRIAPDALTRWPALQRALLEEAYAWLKPGGRLVYATCTLLPAENEHVAEAFGAAHPEMQPEPLRTAPGWHAVEGVADRVSHMATLRPDIHGTDGFFVARWTKPRTARD